MPARPVVAAAALAAALVLPVPAALAAATPAQVLAALNAERAANGLPAGVAEVPEWSAGCARHDDYRALNPGLGIVHDEVPGLPGYTPEGDVAGNSAVLADASWSAGDPYRDAPIHTMRLMDPRLTQAGVDDRDGLSCLSIMGGIGPAAATDAVYTVPGDGRDDVPTAVNARELPFSPGDLVGLPAGATTGPYLLVLADGPFARDDATRLAGVRLAGPGGPVELRTIDDSDPRIAPYIPPGGIAVPVIPLAAGTRYRAEATVVGADGVRLTRRWSFRTAGPVVAPAAEPAPRVGARIQGTADVTVRVRGRRVELGAAAVLSGRPARVRLTLASRTRSVSVRLGRRVGVALRPAEAAAGRTRIAVEVPAFAAGGVSWRVPAVRTSVGRARAASRGDA